MVLLLYFVASVSCCFCITISRVIIYNSCRVAVYFLAPCTVACRILFVVHPEFELNSELKKE